MYLRVHTHSRRYAVCLLPVLIYLRFGIVKTTKLIKIGLPSCSVCARARAPFIERTHSIIILSIKFSAIEKRKFELCHRFVACVCVYVCVCATKRRVFDNKNIQSLFQSGEYDSKNMSYENRYLFLSERIICYYYPFHNNENGERNVAKTWDETNTEKIE